MLHNPTSLVMMFNMRLVTCQTWFPNDCGPYPLLATLNANCTVYQMGGIAIEIAPHSVAFSCGKRDDRISLNYKIVTRIAFLTTTFVAPGSQVSDGRLDRLGIYPSQQLLQVLLSFISDHNTVWEDFLGRQGF